METAFSMLISAHEFLMFGEASLGEDLTVWSPPTQSGSGDPGVHPQTCQSHATRREKKPFYFAV